jgi:beta-phosphoglucomutase-like phosphatase (HAD superfamily)
MNKGLDHWFPTGPAAVLVDLDGTLVDSDQAVERAWVRWAMSSGWSWPRP